MEDEAPVANKNKIKVKEGDGGFWSAVTSFVFLMLFFIVRASVIGDNVSLKLFLVSATFLCALYSSYRKVRFHDYSHRHLWTELLVWVSIVFSLPAIIIYLFFSK